MRFPCFAAVQHGGSILRCCWNQASRSSFFWTLRISSIRHCRYQFRAWIMHISEPTDKVALFSNPDHLEAKSSTYKKAAIPILLLLPITHPQTLSAVIISSLRLLPLVHCHLLLSSPWLPSNRCGLLSSLLVWLFLKQRAARSLSSEENGK